MNVHENMILVKIEKRVSLALYFFSLPLFALLSHIPFPSSFSFSRLRFFFASSFTQALNCCYDHEHRWAFQLIVIYIYSEFIYEVIARSPS